MNQMRGCIFPAAAFPQDEHWNVCLREQLGPGTEHLHERRASAEGSSLCPVVDVIRGRISYVGADWTEIFLDC